jgi:hypothetical protein
MNSNDDNKIESKLAQFRAQRTDSSKTTHSSIKISNIFDSIRKRITSQSKSSQSKSDSINEMSINNSHKMEVNDSENESLLSEESVFPIDDDEEEEESTHLSKTDIIVIIIKTLIYILLQIIAIAIQFGAVFFSIALLFFICTNLRNRKKKRGELSYVFEKIKLT